MIGSYSPRPNLAYRAARRSFALVAKLLFRVHVSGLANLPTTPDGTPAGGWICCGLPHRTWVEPFLTTVLLPSEHRPAILADGRTATRSWWRRLLVRRIGGVIPIHWRGSASDFADYMDAAKDVIDAGGIFLMFPEVGPPSKPPELRRLSAGVSHFAEATGALTVPVIFGGTHELYLRRRIEVRVLPPRVPPPGIDHEILKAWLADFRAVAERAAAEAHLAAEAEPPRRKLWRWLTGPYPRLG